MSRPIRTSFAWLWMATLLTATVGVTVQRIYCYCVGVADVGVFLVEDACQSQAQITGCCAVQKPEEKKAAACCAEQNLCDADLSDAGCSRRTTQLVQLEAEFLVEKPLEKNFEFPAWVPQMPLFRRVVRQMLCETRCDLPLPPPVPPAPYGRLLCVRQQIFRL